MFYIVTPVIRESSTQLLLHDINEKVLRNSFRCLYRYRNILAIDPYGLDMGTAVILRGEPSADTLLTQQLCTYIILENDI